MEPPSSNGGADITGYRIEVSENGSSWTNLTPNSGNTATGYSHAGLTAGSTRYYRVSAINSAGTGPASNTVNATTKSPAATVPGAPEGLTATADGQTEIDLSWGPPSSNGGADITGYRIEVSENGSSWTNLAPNSGNTATGYSHAGLTAGNTPLRVPATTGSGSAHGARRSTPPERDITGI